jgi:hypothetical protein
MWVLVEKETAVNLELCERLTLDRNTEGVWQVIAWTPSRGIYVFESMEREPCVEWIKSMTARMNGRIL